MVKSNILRGDISGDYTWMFDVFLNDTSNNAMFVQNNSFIIKMGIT